MNKVTGYQNTRVREREGRGGKIGKRTTKTLRQFRRCRACEERCPRRPLAWAWTGCRTRTSTFSPTYVALSSSLSPPLPQPPPPPCSLPSLPRSPFLRFSFPLSKTPLFTVRVVCVFVWYSGPVIIWAYTVGFLRCWAPTVCLFLFSFFFFLFTIRVRSKL